MTGIAITTIVRVDSTTHCPKCRRIMTKTLTVPAASLELMNGASDGPVLLAIERARRELIAEASRRGWTGEMCGRCRDPDVSPALPRRIEPTTTSTEESVSSLPIDPAFREFLRRA
jgi:hypothetical protein